MGTDSRTLPEPHFFAHTTDGRVKYGRGTVQQLSSRQDLDATAGGDARTQLRPLVSYTLSLSHCNHEVDTLNAVVVSTMLDLPVLCAQLFCQASANAFI